MIPASIGTTEPRPIESFMQNPPRFLFFTGKGGVGKTSLSCATAVQQADQGKKTLLVSTDPASNLGQVLGVEIRSHPTSIAGVERLWALNIDPRQSAAEYRERVVSPYRGVLPDAAVTEIEEQLSGACTVEIAAFDEFSRLITDDSVVSEYDHIVFDTAPTGHTLRLLNLPSAWKGYLESSSGNASCLGPMSGLKGQQQQFEDTLNALSNESLTRLVLVARPDTHSISEANRTSLELANTGITSQHLVINGVLNEVEGNDPIAMEMHRRQAIAINSIPTALQELPRVEIPLSPSVLIGIPALRGLLQSNVAVSRSDHDTATQWVNDSRWNFKELIDSLDMRSGVIMTMGKGGVGKTTIARMIAVELTKRNVTVHLTTTDPAAHLDLTLSKMNPNLVVSRIDPQVEIERYRQEVMQNAGSQLDAEGKKLLAEDLRSPCTEEIAVFRAFVKAVDEAKDSVVLIDTAPTGHTLLLLDATEAYHREVSRNQSTVPDEVKLLLPRLRDPQFTRIMIVTLPEATPVQEAFDLQVDLKRAGISPYGWVINQCLAPLTVKHPVLQAKRLNEFQHIRHVQEISTRMTIIPWQDANG